ncbi:MAG: dihydroorotase [Chromatiales bacterium 21-64-14]|nr:MAG: dihydroorotase [Chromatiales bacterium 21-64-14]HQU15770.1 dihydroorotase [Gammaproteobacteria bacterium]
MSNTGRVVPAIVVRGGRVIDPASGVDGVHDLYLRDGRIAALDHPPAGFHADREIDANGSWVFPGLVDLCARLREPGQEHKATIASETAAAVRAGITTLCCPPDTQPVIDTPAVVELIRQRAELPGRARVFTLGALTRGLEGNQLSEMAALKAAGCVGVSNGWQPLASTLVLRRALEYAATFDLTVFLHPEDPYLHDGGCAHEGAVATRLGLPGIPEAAETAAVASALALIEQTGVRAHFCRLSTARAVQMVARARHDGLPISADVCAHQLFLTETDLAEFNSQYHVRPPLRTVRDRDGLRAGVARGTIAAICSDHQPHEPDAKLAPFPATAPGISALETLLPLTLRQVHEGGLDLPTAIARVTVGPAQILGLPYGTLGTGRAADLCILDPERPWRLGPRAMASHGLNTPFLGWEFTGQVTHTLVAGRVVFEAEAELEAVAEARRP